MLLELMSVAVRLVFRLLYPWNPSHDVESPRISATSKLAVRFT